MYTKQEKRETIGIRKLEKMDQKLLEFYFLLFKRLFFSLEQGWIKKPIFVPHFTEVSPQENLISVGTYEREWEQQALLTISSISEYKSGVEEYIRQLRERKCKTKKRA